MGVYIKSREQYNKIVALASKVFKLNKQLPEVVFVSGMDQPKATEFCFFVPEEFANLIKSLASFFDEQAVYLLAQVPSPEVTEYWDGGYGALKLSGSWTPEDFMNAISDPGDVPGTMPMKLCNSIYIFGASGKWGSYADYDFAVILTSVKFETDEFQWPESTLLAKRDIVFDIVTTNARDSELVNTFMENYFNRN